MLSRRHLRVKVLQALYAFFQSGNDNLQSGEKQLVQSIEKLNEQYVYILSFLIAVFDFAARRIEEAKNKYLPTDDDLNPNLRFIHNRVYKQISANTSFQKLEEKYKINWSEETELLRRFYIHLKEDRKYLEYMSAGNDAFNSDKEIVLNILKNNASDFESLEVFFEDRNIYWASDYYIAIWLVVKYIKTLKPESGNDTPLPSIIHNLKENDNDDWDFLIRLFRKAVVKSSEYEKLIDDRAQNWELDRIAAMDKLILKMAITELIEFPSIPIKVTLNEYIELAKLFSTTKSRVFINGVLDKLIIDLQENGQIVKKGRGLIT